MKKTLLVLTLASTLILASCGTKPVSSSASETNSDSDSVSTSTSTSSSSSSTVSPVDPEAAYKVSEGQFVDIFMNQLANVTIDATGEGLTPPYSGIIFSGMMSQWSMVSSFYTMDHYLKVDEKGVQTGMDCSAGNFLSPYNPVDTGCLNGTSFYEAYRVNFLYMFLNFTSVADLVGGTGMNFYYYTFHAEPEALSQYLKTYYASLTYDSATHSYKGVQGKGYNSGYPTVPYFSFLNQALKESKNVMTKEDGTVATTTYAYSKYGSSAITNLTTETANYLNYHTVRFYDEDETTILEKKYVSYGNSFSYTGSYRRALKDDTCAYALQGWEIMGTSTLLDGAFFLEDYGNHDLVAVWQKVDNADLYYFDSANGVLAFKGHDGVGSLKVPSTYSGVAVTALNLDTITSKLTEIYLPASVGKVTRSTTTSSNLFLSNIEFTVDSTSTKLLVKDGALLSKDGTTLYSFYSGSPNRQFVGAKTLTTINDFAFASGYIKEVDLSATSVSVLGLGVFFESLSLKKITLPSSLTEIGQNCFTYASNLTTINLEDTGLTMIDKYAFGYCTALTSVSFPATLLNIGDYAFEYSALHSLSLPASLKSIGASAFCYCRSLQAVTADASIAAPDLLAAGSAFNGCTKLKTFVIPSSVTTIGTNNFQGCSSDLKIYLGATALPSGYQTGWNAIDSKTTAEYLLYSETQPTDTTQRYWHYDTNKNPVIWTVA